MKLGVVFPTMEIGSDPIAIRDFVQTVDALGFDYLMAYDRVLGVNPDRPGGWTGPYTHHDAFHEPLVLFGYIAALTQRVRLVTGTVILPQRQTVLLAKQAAELDILSRGRLTLGVAVGWNDIEYAALEQNFRTRAERCEEQIAVLRLLWTQPLVTFAGKYHTVPDAGINPLPLQRPIPVWFGGMADRVLRRMARLGDGWLVNGPVDDALRARLDALRQYLLAEGRDPRSFGFERRIGVGDVPRQEWRHRYEEWSRLGGTQFGINTMEAGFTSLDQHLAAIRQFHAEFGPSPAA
jgi:probable F420-dependent oxidoreductase